MFFSETITASYYLQYYCVHTEPHRSQKVKATAWQMKCKFKSFVRHLNRVFSIINKY
uniref:Uncharacterized protein n=1 Tax=Anser cygnoides TaxID=8845 RepID=A0A8B9EBB8_ANSCY